MLNLTLTTEVRPEIELNKVQKLILEICDSLVHTRGHAHWQALTVDIFICGSLIGNSLAYIIDGNGQHSYDFGRIQKKALERKFLILQNIMQSYSYSPWNKVRLVYEYGPRKYRLYSRWDTDLQAISEADSVQYISERFGCNVFDTIVSWPGLSPHNRPWVQFKLEGGDELKRVIM